MLVYFLFLDTRDIVQYLHLTRHMESRLRDVYGRNSYQSEPELVSEGDEESTFGITDTESEFGDV